MTSSNADKILRLYMAHVKANPVRTKALTSAMIGSIGEVLAQYLCHLKQRKHKEFTSCGRRVLVTGLYGGFVTGPLLHWWYSTLEKLVPAASQHATGAKLVLDRLLFTPPFLALTIFSWSVLNGTEVSEAKKHLRKVMWKALQMNWKVWTITQWISFTYIPPRFRVLWGNLIALWWNCYLSLTAQ